jgi:hypothetical protein
MSARCAWCEGPCGKRRRYALVNGRHRRVCDRICETIIVNHSKATRDNRPVVGAREEAEWSPLATQGSPDPETTGPSGSFRRVSKRAQKSTDDN